ncbi:MAG: sugar phosphate isomerase/epimerase, partial [Vallitaleaceae bacterium]|nr:sugar phosphate isomerase/epimerase [Vallitaleaceae bacterium]
MSRFVLSGFADEIEADFITQLKGLKSLNIGYIEIRGVNGRNITDHSLEEIKVIKKQLQDFDIKVSAIGSPIGKIDMKADYDQHYELFKHTIAIASSLETRYIRLFSFFMEEEAVSANEATV